MTNQWSIREDDVPAAARPGQTVGTVGPDDGVEPVGEDETHRSAVDAVDGLLDEVERALARLDDGTYGRCETCGEPIGDDRLSEHPVVRTCATCDGAGEATATTGPPAGASRWAVTDAAPGEAVPT